jgi:WD40 repeat protein/uncharacterized caspase-like protein
MCRLYGHLVPLAVLLGWSPASATWADEPTNPAQGPVHLIVQIGHNSIVNSAAFSPNGKLAVSGSADFTAILWEIDTGRQLRTFQHRGRIHSVAFSRDGRDIATASWDGTVGVWEVTTGRKKRSFDARQQGALAFSPNGKHLYSAGTLWDLESGANVHTVEEGPGTIVAAFSPNGRSIAVASGATVTERDALTGAKRKSFQVHDAKVSSLTYSPDGKHILTGSADETSILWDAATGNKVQTFDNQAGPVTSVAFNAKGDKCLTGLRAGLIRVWDVASGKALWTFRCPSSVTSAAFSPDEKSILITVFGSEVFLCRWNGVMGSLTRVLGGGVDSNLSLKISRDGAYLCGFWNSAGLPSAHRWDLATGQLIDAASAVPRSSDTPGPPPGPQPVGWAPIIGQNWGNGDFSADGKLALIGSHDRTVGVWDLESAKKGRMFAGHAAAVNCVAWSPEGKQALTASFDRTLVLWDASTGEKIRSFEEHKGQVLSMTFSPDGKKVIVASVAKDVIDPDGRRHLSDPADKNPVLWEVVTGKRLRSFEGHGDLINAAAFSSDGARIVTGSNDNTAILWDAVTGAKLHSFSGHTNRVNAVAFSSDDKAVLTGSTDKSAILWDASSGRKLQLFDGHSYGITAVAFGPQAKTVLTSSPDATTRIWDRETGRELCRLVRFRDGSWAAVDAEGRYDASDRGDVEGLHWVAGLETISLKQLKKHYYDPGLLAKYLGGKKQPLRPVEALKNVRLAPEVESELVSQDGKLTIQLVDRGGGIGRVQVFLNGKEVSADARSLGVRTSPDARRATLEVDLSGVRYSPGAKNSIRIVPWNKDDALSGRGAEREWDAPGERDRRAPDLYAVAVGVSEYAETRLRLRFAAKDAQDFARALTLAGQRLLEPAGGKVHVTLLSDSDDGSSRPPSRANLIKAFETVAASAKPSDLLIVYLAGHGVALEAKDELLYCYLTQEANSTNRADLSDAEWRLRNAVTSAELTDWFKKIPANKQVLFLDTCAAGAAASKLMEHRDIDAEAVRALDRLQERSGFHVLMGCAADRVSYETTRYGQGLLTYSLLEGMKGAALREGEFVDVSKLFQHAADRVPQLAQNVGGIQRPMIMAPRGTSFDVGRLLAEDKQKIPLAADRPLLLRPKMVNPDADNDDDLGLEPLLSKRLLLASSYQVRGAGAAPALVFIDAAELPGAIRPVGTYTVQGEKVTVRIALRRDKTTLTTVHVEGNRNELPELAVRMTAEITASLSKTPLIPK